MSCTVSSSPETRMLWLHELTHTQGGRSVNWLPLPVNVNSLRALTRQVFAGCHSGQLELQRLCSSGLEMLFDVYSLNEEDRKERSLPSWPRLIFTGRSVPSASCPGIT